MKTMDRTHGASVPREPSKGEVLWWLVLIVLRMRFFELNLEAGAR